MTLDDQQTLVHKTTSLEPVWVKCGFRVLR